jgi:hypothetical protein
MTCSNGAAHVDQGLFQVLQQQLQANVVLAYRVCTMKVHAPQNSEQTPKTLPQLLSYTKTRGDDEWLDHQFMRPANARHPIHAINSSHPVPSPQCYRLSLKIANVNE